jgi:hypothetical protein
MQEYVGNRREFVLSLAKGLLCPSCKRAIQIYDFEPTHGSAFQINCGGCHRTLLAYEEPRR